MSVAWALLVPGRGRLVPCSCRRAGAHGPGPPLVRAAGDHTANTGVSSRRHPQVMARRHRHQTQGLDSARQARPSRSSAFHLVRRPSISFVHGTRWTCAERGRRARSEIKTWATRSTCQERASALHLVPRPSISFVHATRSTCEERGRRTRSEIKTWATRSTPVVVGSSGRRDQTRPSWRVLVAPRRARGALPPSSCSVTVLCQDVGDTWGVCVGDTSGWPRGRCPRLLAHWARGSRRPGGPGAATSSSSHRCARARPPLARRWCPRGGHQPWSLATPRPGGARSRRTPPRGRTPRSVMSAAWTPAGPGLGPLSRSAPVAVRVRTGPGRRWHAPRCPHGHRHPRSVETPVRRPRP